jgi:hypothetical protein
MIPLLAALLGKAGGAAAAGTAAAGASSAAAGGAAAGAGAKAGLGSKLAGLGGGGGKNKGPPPDASRHMGGPLQAPSGGATPGVQPQTSTTPFVSSQRQYGDGVLAEYMRSRRGGLLR